MKRAGTLAALICLLLGGGLRMAGAQAEIQVVPQTADAKIYGEYPIAYKEIITKWMEGRLVDPSSAVYEWIGEPRPGEVSPQKGKRYVGYLVDFKVNARNQFGAPTGKQKYQAVLRNGDVLWAGHPR